MEGLVFETRADDKTFTLEDELDQLVVEESWRNPEKFGHLESAFDAHLLMLAKMSQELGIFNNYSEELLSLNDDLRDLQGQMMSFDSFYQMMCACPEDFGLSQDSLNTLSHSADDGHNHAEHAHNQHAHNHKEEEKKDKKNGKKKKKRSGWTGLLGLLMKK